VAAAERTIEENCRQLSELLEDVTRIAEGRSTTPLDEAVSRLQSACGENR